MDEGVGILLVAVFYLVRYRIVHRVHDIVKWSARTRLAHQSESRMYPFNCHIFTYCRLVIDIVYQRCLTIDLLQVIVVTIHE